MSRLRASTLVEAEEYIQAQEYSINFQLQINSGPGRRSNIPHLPKAEQVMGNLMETAFNSIEEICDLFVVQFSHTPEGHDYFYLYEQSSLQILKDLPIETAIEVTNILSESERIRKEINKIKLSITVGHFFENTLPLVENGIFLCNDITIIINNELELKCIGDGEVHLTSPNFSALFELVNRVFIRQHYRPSVLTTVMSRPDFYHKVDRPNTIASSHKTFEQVFNAP